MNIAKRHTVLMLLAVLTGLPFVAQAAGKKVTVPAKTKSVFIMPTNTEQGRDPFFPESTRIYDELLATSHTNQVVELPPLTVPGISGTPGHLLAIINNHTFAAGDEGDVLTPSGKKVHIHCIEVDMDHVIVEIDGHDHRIKVGDQ